MDDIAKSIPGSAGGLAAGPLAGLLSAGGRDRTRGARAGEIAAITRAVFGLADGAAVTVSQLTCREPGCPPVETVIAVVGHPPRRWRVHRPLNDISDDLVLDLLTDNPDGDNHD